MRVGFFGGSFDPPHLGHLAVARAARAECSLIRVLLAPTGLQPLKPAGTTAAYADRLHMTELLCADEAELQSSDVDAPRPGREANYTIDTLTRLRAALPAGDTVFVIVGADSFLDLRRWRAPDALLAAAEWIVVSRPGIALDDFRSLGLTPAQRERVHALQNVHVPVSATEIRERLSSGGDTSGMLSQPVEQYIRKRHLYGT